MEGAQDDTRGRPALCGQSQAGPAAAQRRQQANAQRPRLVAFFAVIYYAGLRPEEAVNLRRENITLPPLVRNDVTGEWEEPADNWGELRFCSASTEIGAEWTDDNTRREHRQLKSRPIGEWRRVPTAPPLTRILHSHLECFGTGKVGRVFSGIQRGELASITYRRAWGKARSVALTPAEYASPLARRVYDLRHACVSTWLNGGVPPAQVAEWAGHSVAVLLKVYAKCIDGQDQIAKRRIEDALRETDDDQVAGAYYRVAEDNDDDDAN
jgi:integrase